MARTHAHHNGNTLTLITASFGRSFFRSGGAGANPFIMMRNRAFGYGCGVRIYKRPVASRPTPVTAIFGSTITNRITGRLKLTPLAVKF